MTVLSEAEDAIKDHSAGAQGVPVRDSCRGAADDPVAELVSELIEQWRDQLGELRLKS